MTRSITLAAATILFALVSEPAFAHDGGLSVTASFQHGFLHPITGLDHLIAMVGIGLLSALVGGRAVFTVPAVFVASLLVGGAFGFYAIELVGVERWILASLLALGVVLARSAKPHRELMFGAIALFGFAHGNAHGLELPLAASASGYAAGFALASSACHASGILLALAATRTRLGSAPIRAAGLATCGFAIYMSSSAITG